MVTHSPGQIKGTLSLYEKIRPYKSLFILTGFIVPICFSITASRADEATSVEIEHKYIINTNPVAREISQSTSTAANVKIGSFVWQAMGMQNISGSTGTHGDYAISHLHTLRAIKSGAIKVGKNSSELIVDSSGNYSFRDLALLVVSNAYSRPTFYELPKESKLVYKATGAPYGNAGRPSFPFNYSSVDFPKDSNDNADGTASFAGITVNGSDANHFQYNYASALGLPEFRNQIFIETPSFVTPGGKPIPLDVSSLAAFFMKKQAMSAAGQIRNYWLWKPYQTSISWQSASGFASCNSIAERATARMLTTLIRAYKLKSIEPEDAVATKLFLEQFVIPCYLNMAPGANWQAGSAKPIGTVPPVTADSGLSYFSGWGTALKVSALYETAQAIKPSHPALAAKIMQIVAYKARWVNEMISLNQSMAGTPALPYAVSFASLSSLSAPDGTPVKSLMPGFESGQLIANYTVSGVAGIDTYGPAYSPWAYNALRIAETLGIPGARQNADKILQAAKDCLIHNTGDLCGWNAHRSLTGYIVEADGSSRLIAPDGSLLP